MNQYKPTIGLEIHVELKTRTKMFCGCLNDPNEKTPNTNVCPICLAHPGVLPTINREAVESVVKLGLALSGNIAEKSHFDRKSYFYPDLPKGYQISQYEEPLVKGGGLNNVKIRRIHLEEDTGRLLHNSHKSSSVDFNRAGLPLMELVTEPDLKSGEEVTAFAKELQLILRYLKIANADMEKGEMRIEANVSVSQSDELGIKVELKNINSFAFMKETINYEIQRQIQILEKGELIMSETRGTAVVQNIRISKLQRPKEEANDYRYFEEPDLPPLNLTNTELIDIEKLRDEMTELPSAKRERFIKEFNLTSSQSKTLVDAPEAAEFFEETVSELKTEISPPSQSPACLAAAYQRRRDTSLPRRSLPAKAGLHSLIFNYLTSDLFGLMKSEKIGWPDLKITPENFADLIALIFKGDLTSRMAKDIILEMQASGEDPRAVIERMGVSQISDENLIKEVITQIIAENPKAVMDYQKGNENALQFMVGKTMAVLKGQGNPELIKKILKQELS